MLADAAAFGAGVVAVLFATFLTTTVATVAMYHAVRRRAPSAQTARTGHVVSLGAVVVVLSAQAVAATLLAGGTLGLALTGLNLVLFAYGNAAVLRLARHEYRQWSRKP